MKALALSFAMMLWQGTFAQPQLDGRYGVDRVAMAQEAKQAAHQSQAPLRITVRDCKTRALLPIFADTGLMIPLANPLISDARGGYEFHVEAKTYCSEISTIKSENLHQSQQPSPQITAVRAVEHVSVCTTNGASGECHIVDFYCTDDSAIGPFTNRKGEHWCLKIEEGK